MSILPPSMLAMTIPQPGGPEVLALANCPVPQPKPGQVLIQVAAAGVNRPDVMQRLGLYPPPAGASEIPGLEISGKIVALGEQVSQSIIGTEVTALVTGGGYAEYCVADAALCLPVPDGLTLQEAAALPETFFTVWSNVFMRAQLRAGNSLLVHGGSSGIGTTAIQLAKAFGAKVIVTAGSETKCAFCLALGADYAINYRSTDFVTAIKDYTQAGGVQVILDMVGGDYLMRNLQCLAPEGTLLQIGVQAGVKSEINLLPIMLKRLTLSGSTLRARDVSYKVSIAKQLQQQVWPLLASRQIKPIIHTTFTLPEAAAAHRLMESSQHLGKIILKVANL